MYVSLTASSEKFVRLFCVSLCITCACWSVQLFCLPLEPIKENICLAPKVPSEPLKTQHG